ncbi:MAG TPA: 50S ribosomal protein L17 [Myxococcales bacterium LLY-WYZ-16_1]|jgi:large subunit ribosomal protein L17|nr:50S ribosomal protein L17 [Myxococcales bacterium LLY-WYZ-16_1]
MRHRKAFRKFSRTSSHRRAMFANMAMALVENGRIRTTEPKAKELRRVAERLVTMGKKGTPSARRQVFGILGGPGKHARPGNEERRQEKVVEALFSDLAERFRDRPGGYTRVVKLGPRQGDAAPMAFIEFVDFDFEAAEAD